MRKLLGIVCAIALCMACFALVACGNSSSSGDASAAGGSAATASDSASAEGSSSAASEDETFIGDWKLAAAEGDGVTFAGDFKAMYQAQSSIDLTLGEDGKGTLSFDGESEEVSWEAVDDTNATLTISRTLFDDKGLSSSEAAKQEDSITVEIVLEDGSLSIPFGNRSYASTMIFTRDGQMAKLPDLDVSKAKDITSADDLKGSWTLTAVDVNSMLLYGESERLAGLINQDDVEIVFKDDGLVDVMGADSSYEVSDKGATIKINDTDFTLRMSGDDLLLEYPEETTGIQMVERFSKD